jgi:hypothetical protein
MGSVTIRDTQSVGDSFSEVEYTFESSSDFFAWDELKRESLSQAVKSFVGGFDESAVTGVEVKKKETKH